jgi:hypothetical protein
MHHRHQASAKKISAILQAENMFLLIATEHEAPIMAEIDSFQTATQCVPQNICQ